MPTELRVPCDRSADQRFVETFERTDWITVVRVEDVLPPDAPDRAISDYAEEHEWIVFTEGSDFLNHDHHRGLVRYHPLDDPSPGDVVEALRAIADAFPDHREIEQRVPDGWVT